MECETCVCVWLGAGRARRGEWVTGLGSGVTNSGGTWGKWDMCLCCGYGGVRGERGAAWARVLEGGVALCGGFLRILAAPSVESCCTLSISAS